MHSWNVNVVRTGLGTLYQGLHHQLRLKTHQHIAIRGSGMDKKQLEEIEKNLKESTLLPEPIKQKILKIIKPNDNRPRTLNEALKRDYERNRAMYEFKDVYKTLPKDMAYQIEKVLNTPMTMSNETAIKIVREGLKERVRRYRGK
jgi:hypothetical protein